MNETKGRNTELSESQKELQRLIVWSADNLQDWRRICNPESYHPTLEYMGELIERLYKANLLTVIYYMLHSNNNYVRGMDWVIGRTVAECFVDIPICALIDKFRKNLETAIKEEAQEEQRKQ